MRDTILCDGQPRVVAILRPPCRHLGERTAHRSKRKCENSADLLPIYRCGKYRLCSPFGITVDADLLHPCEGCQFYQRRLAENDQMINDTDTTRTVASS